MSIRNSEVLAVLAMGGLLMGSSVLMADEKAPSKEAKVTYDDQVRPILREHCFSCHNQNQAKGGLALDNYGKLMEGGSSGEVVVEEDLDSSRLWSLVSHEEEPYMPPGQDKLPDAKLAVISKWIETGLLENAGAKVKAKKPALSLAAPTTTGKPEGPVAMPEGLSREPVVFTPRAAAISALASSPWAPLVAVAGQRQVALYNSDSGLLIGVLPFPEGIPYSLRFSRDGSLLLVGGGRGGSAGCAALYDVRTGKRLLKVGDELDAVLSADINVDLTRIALGGPGRIVRIFSTETGEQVHEIRKHTDWIYAVRFSPDGVLLATADRTNGLFVWEAETAREYLNLRGHAAGILDVAWRSDSNVLASASLDGTVKLWEMNDGKSIKSRAAHSGGVNAVAFTHDGRIATAGQDKTAKVWDGGLNPVKTFPPFGEPALRVTFTHDGSRIVAGDWSGFVKMWDVASAKEVGQLPANPPTLAMQVAQQETRLKTAMAQAAKQEAALKALEQAVTQLASKNAAAVAAAESNARKRAEVAAKSAAELTAIAAQVAAGQATMKSSQMALEQARKALAAAESKLQLAKTALSATLQREKTLKAALPKAQQAAAKAAEDAKRLKAGLAKKVQEAAKDVPAHKVALKNAAADLAELQARIQKLKAEQAAARQAAGKPNSPAAAPKSK